MASFPNFSWLERLPSLPEEKHIVFTDEKLPKDDKLVDGDILGDHVPKKSHFDGFEFNSKMSKQGKRDGKYFEMSPFDEDPSEIDPIMRLLMAPFLQRSEQKTRRLKKIQSGKFQDMKRMTPFKQGDKRARMISPMFRRQPRIVSIKIIKIMRMPDFNRTGKANGTELTFNKLDGNKQLQGKGPSAADEANVLLPLLMHLLPQAFPELAFMRNASIADKEVHKKLPVNAKDLTNDETKELHHIQEIKVDEKSTSTDQVPDVVVVEDPSTTPEDLTTVDTAVDMKMKQ